MAPKDQSRSKSITTKSQKREDVRVVKKIADSTPKEFESKDASEEKVGDADEKVDDDGIDDDEEGIMTNLPSSPSVLWNPFVWRPKN
jgi:hypothetical protein